MSIHKIRPGFFPGEKRPINPRSEGQKRPEAVKIDVFHNYRNCLKPTPGKVEKNRLYFGKNATP